MQHLDPERLAALVEEPPAAAEAAHLAACLACRRERDALVALVALTRDAGGAAWASEAPPAAAPADGAVAGGGPSGAPSDAAWARLAGALRAEGLLDDAYTSGARPAASRGAALAQLPPRAVAPAVPRRAPAPTDGPPAWGGGWRGEGAGVARAGRGWRLAGRAAAALLLLAAGTAYGRASAGAPALPWSAGAAGVASRAAMPVPGTGGATLAEPALAWPVADRRGSAGAAGFAGVDEASQALARAQEDYQRAAAWLAEHDATATAAGEPAALRARLAALDEVVPRVREAVAGAPQDPVLNQVYLTAYDVRETTLRQLGRAQPAGARLVGY